MNRDRAQAMVDPWGEMIAVVIMVMVTYTASDALNLDFAGFLGLLAAIAATLSAALAIYQRLGGELGVELSRSRDKTDRGAITVPDIAYFLIALAALAALVPVFMDQLNANTGVMMRETELFMLAITPLTILVIFTILYQKAVTP